MLRRMIMQVFTPFAEPFRTAQAMIADRARFNKQIIECRQIISVIDGRSGAWANHPVVKQYAQYVGYLSDYLRCFCAYRELDFDSALHFSRLAELTTPAFLTGDFCDQHKRRLYSKAPLKYPQFAAYGGSDVNWYFVDGQVIKYRQGKRILI